MKYLKWFILTMVGALLFGGFMGLVGFAWGDGPYPPPSDKGIPILPYRAILQSEAEAPAPLIHMPLIQNMVDIKGVISGWEIERASASTYVDRAGVLRMANGVRNQLFANPGVPVTQDIAVTAGTTYIGSWGSGGSVVFSDSTSTSTQQTIGGWPVITVTGTGNLTATVTGTPSYVMLEDLYPTGTLTNYAPSSFTISSTIPSQPRFEQYGLSILNKAVSNLLPYSEDFSVWNNNSTVDTGSYADPAGNTAAYRSTTSTSNIEVLESVSASASTTYTFSVFVKNVSMASDLKLAAYDQGFTLLSSVSILSSINASTWTRVSLEFTTAIDDTGVKVGFTSSEDGTQFLLYGANLTATTFVAPYIPSDGAVTAIAAERAIFPMPAELLNVISDLEGSATSEGTMIVDYTPGYDSQDPGETSGIVASTGVVVTLLYMSSSPADKFITRDGGTNTSLNLTTATVKNDQLRAAVIWSKTSGTFQLGMRHNGVWETWSSSAYDGSYNTSDSLYIGNGNVLPFMIKSLRFYDYAMTTTFIEENF